METWQTTHIIKNLPHLLPLTVCNAQFLAELRAADLLADVDVKAIKAEKNHYNRASLIYEILQTRTNGYYGIIRALIATNQSGAAKILLKIPSTKIENLRITLQGEAYQLNQLLSKDEIEAIKSWANNNLTMNDCVRIHETIQAAETLELVRDTIPKPHALYIPRLLSRRLGVKPDIFEKDCSDVFVFKEIEQSQLQKFVKLHKIASSCEQLLQRNITSRFLLLDCDADWKRICDNVKSPAHLIKFEESTETFRLEDTTGGSSALRPHLQHQQDSSSELVSEDKFLEMISVDKVCGVCICDSPGMGKSLLLANLARKAREKWPDRIISFIQLQNIVIQKESVEAVTLKTLDLISTSSFASQILYELYKRNYLSLELFLDGLDEVQHENLDCTTKFLQRICEVMQSTTVYVTSRPVVRAQLEKAMGMIAYDIQPFNAETQLDYLTNHWAQAASTADMTKLAEYAEYCIQGFHQTVKDNERNIAGVPLMCWLLAEVYAGKAATYADTSRKKPTNLPDHFVSSLYEIYKEFTARQLGETKCKFACLYEIDLSEPRCDLACLIYSFHVWQGLKLLVPKYSLKLGKYVVSFENLLPCQILAPGVLDEGQQNHTYVFVHRTFAEYLVAEYFAKNFLWVLDGLQATSQSTSQINYLGLNEILLTDKERT